MDRKEIVLDIFQNIDAMGRNLSGKNPELFSKGMPTKAQIGVLLAISYNGPQNIKDLAAKFGMTSSAATQLVNGLVTEGMLTRTEDKVDRRKTRLELTKRAEKNIIYIKRKRYEMMSETLEALNPRELLQLKHIQQKITQRVKLLWNKSQAK